MKNYWKKHLVNVKESQYDRDKSDYSECGVEWQQKLRVLSSTQSSQDGTVVEEKARIVAPVKAVKIITSLPDKPECSSEERESIIH